MHSQDARADADHLGGNSWGIAPVGGFTLVALGVLGRELERPGLNPWSSLWPLNIPDGRKYPLSIFEITESWTPLKVVADLSGFLQRGKEMFIG